MAAVTLERPKKRKENLIPIGTPVRFPFGTTERDGVIVEHRGPLAPGGHQLYGADSPGEYHNVYVELTAEEFQAAK